MTVNRAATISQRRAARRTLRLLSQVPGASDEDGPRLEVDVLPSPEGLRRGRRGARRPRADPRVLGRIAWSANEGWSRGLSGSRLAGGRRSRSGTVRPGVAGLLGAGWVR